MLAKKYYSVILTICFLRAYNSQWTTGTPSPDGNDSTTRAPVQEKHSSHVVIRIKDKPFLLGEGVLIGEQYALTTARCVNRYESHHLEVVAGLNSTQHIDWNENAQIRRVAQIKLHPSWHNSTEGIGDLAILELLDPFKKTENVDISSYGTDVLSNETVRLVGYGDSEKISSTTLKVSSKSDKNRTETFVMVEYNEYYEDTFSDLSYSGAPIFSKTVENEVLGLVSSDTYGTNTNLAFYADWIESNTNIRRSTNSTQSSNSWTTSSPSNSETSTKPVN